MRANEGSDGRHGRRILIGTWSITGVHSNQDPIRRVKIGVYMSFWVHRGFWVYVSFWVHRGF